MQPMSEQEVHDRIRKTGALLDGHFRYAANKHGSKYVDKYKIYPHTRLIYLLCKEIADRFAFVTSIDTVVAPEKGGIILSHSVGFSLTMRVGREVCSVFAEKKRTIDDFEFAHGFSKFVNDKNVLVVEDTINSGKTSRKIIQLVREYGGRVIGLGAIWNLGGVTAADLEIPILSSLVNIAFKSWKAMDCPLCAQGVPINFEVGRGPLGFEAR